MKLADIIHKISVFFASKKTKKRDYSVKTANVHFRDIPYSAYLVIKKYGWAIFFYKAVDFLKKFPGECVRKMKYLHQQTISSFRNEGFGKMILRILNYIFYGKGVLSRKEIIKRRYKFKPEIFNNEHIYVLDFSMLKEIAFAKKDNPEASIIIPVFNKWKFTYNCLESLKNNIKSIAYEVIVVDDGSMDETKEMIKKIKNVVYIKNEKNLGFVESCNAGAKKAKGKYVVFLNNDTSVKENWLSALLETFQNDKNIGLVGSKFIYPDERLQEAGGIVWKNKNICNYGRYKKPNDPEFNYLKDVDYCSGASIILPKDVFEKLGGFDIIFSPGYYEDTDLAFRVRQLGLRTVYQPKSELFHFEGITAGTDLSKGMKKYQEINKKKFFKRWRDVLEKENLDDSLDGPFLARDRSAKKRVMLFMDNNVPTFDKDAGSFIAYNYLRIFLELGYKIVFWPHNLIKLEPYAEELQQLGIEVIYGQQSFGKYIKENGKFFDLAFVSRPHVAEAYLETIEKYSKAKILYIPHDLHFLREARTAEIKNDDNLKKQAKKTKKLEISIMKRCSNSLFFSDREVEMINNLNSEIKCDVIPWIQALAENNDQISFENRGDLLFLGGFDHKPNVDAMLWFHNEILPKLKKVFPQIVLTVLGSHPPKEVLNLNSNDFNVVGFVKEEDLSIYFNKAKIFITPLRFGAGFKGKIAKAMSFGLPVVTTEIGAEGIGLIDGETAFIANDVDSYVAKIVTLYSSEELWNKISKNSFEHVRINFSVKNASNKISEILKKI